MEEKNKMGWCINWWNSPSSLFWINFKWSPTVMHWLQADVPRSRGESTEEGWRRQTMERSKERENSSRHSAQTGTESSERKQVVLCDSGECPIINWSECSPCEIFWMRLDSEWMRMILTASCVWEFDVSDIVASLYCWSLHACLMPALWVCCKKFWVCALVWSTVEIGKCILSQGPLLLQDCWCLAVTVCHQWL